MAGPKVTVEVVFDHGDSASEWRLVALCERHRGLRVATKSDKVVTFVVEPELIHVSGPALEAAATQLGATLHIVEIDALVPTEGLGGRPSEVWAAIADAAEDIRLARRKGDPGPDVFSRISVGVEGQTRVARRSRSTGGLAATEGALSQDRTLHGNQSDDSAFLSVADIEEIDRAADAFEATIARRFGAHDDPWAHRRRDLEALLPNRIDQRLPRTTSRVGAEDEAPELVRALRALDLDPRGVGVATAIVVNPTAAVSLYETPGRSVEDVRRALTDSRSATPGERDPALVQWASIVGDDTRAIVGLEGAIAVVGGDRKLVEQLLDELVPGHLGFGTASKDQI